MDKFIAHILVVDDDDGIRSLVKKYLNENKFLVTTAENAENALEKIKIIKFDLIVLDIMMPGKSGYEFSKEIKSKDCPPIIFLTAKGEVEDRIKNKMSVYNLSSDKRENQFAQGVKLEIMENNDLPSYISHNLKKYEEWLA